MCEPAVKGIRLEHPFVFGSRCSHASAAPGQPAGRARWLGLAAACLNLIHPGRPGAQPRWDSVGPQPSWSLNVESVMQLSARNQIPARVTSINAGEAIANVELSANGVRLVASITVEAVRELGLAEGSNVTAVIKASEVMLAADGGS